MFPIESKYLFINGLYDITSNYLALLSDGVIDILFTGTNKFGNKIIGSILFEDDEELYLRYANIIVTDQDFNSFFGGNVSLRSLFDNSETICLVDKDYNGRTKEIHLVPTSEVPTDFLPLENSFCPDNIQNTSLEYTFSLKGGLADMHKAYPEIMSDTNSKVFAMLTASTRLFEELRISPKIYSEVAIAGSFELNFEIDLFEQESLFNISNVDIRNFIYKFYKYIFEKLPNEPDNVLSDSAGATDDLKVLFNEMSEIYKERGFPENIDGSEQKVIDLITYSVDAIKGVQYTGFDKIEISNKISTEEKMPVALIESNYYASVVNKVFKPEVDPEDVVEIDDNPKLYRIQVFNLHNETGNGGAYFTKDEQTFKVSLHLRGKSSYYGSIYTKSQHEHVQIDVQGIGKWVNGVLKEITVVHS